MSEQEALLNEINDPHTNHQRRRDIGERLSKLGDPRPGVGVREDGLPDIIWLPVTPGGNITLQNEAFVVPPFYIAKYLLTYLQYQAFFKAKDGYNNPEWWQGFPNEYQQQKLNKPLSKAQNNPRDTISWYQSVAFARWLNQQMKGLELPNPEGNPFIVGQNAQVRLPTEWEWQWAAQGGMEQREYPWGDWQKDCVNTLEAGLSRAVAVGLYPQGAADCGVLDMSGNLWEWCANDYESIKTVDVGNNAFKALRGGSYRNSQSEATCAYRYYFYPGKDYHLFGLRLVISGRG
jgi:formylglycine-generating enzyme required for sulfatase activity